MPTLVGYPQSALVRGRFNNMFSSCALRNTSYKCLGFCFLAVIIFICTAYRQIGSEFNYKTFSTLVKISDNNNANQVSLLPYYVENSQCKIPSLDPFADEVMVIYKPKVFETCANESDLVTPIFDMASKRYVLHINSSVISEIHNSSEMKYTCYYQEITRNDNHGVPFIFTFQLESPTYFSHGYKVPLHVEALILNCHESRNISNIIQTDGYALIQYKPRENKRETVEGTTEVETTPAEEGARTDLTWEEETTDRKESGVVQRVVGRVEQPPGKESTDSTTQSGSEAATEPFEDSKLLPRKPSVIMFGLDTMSRMNLRRTMPKVYQFLTQSSWFELQGYNKVADNTYPNLLAVLSGYTPETAKKKVCDTSESACLDSFPFIWKDLKEAGYLTAYAEDAFHINTFRLHKQGFTTPPTDYYHLPFMEAFENQLDTWKCKECTMDYCIGRKQQSSYVFDYMKEYAKRYLNDRPIWGLFWSSSFTHDDFSLASKMDNFILQYFKDFERDAILDENIVVFFSDHGARFGELRQTSGGFLESRLPMLFIHLPAWFRNQYPEYARALELNRNRLTSNYDLYNTLRHIIEIGGNTSLPKSADCPKCQSLFYPIENLRSCADAGIPEHYCTCQPYKTIYGEWTDRISELVIDQINNFLWVQDLNSRCENLTLNNTQNAEIKIELDMKFHSEIPKLDTAQYHITFVVKESGAIFFATVIYNRLLDKVEVDISTISRLNEYVLDSHCVADKLAKLFCICKNKLLIPPIKYYSKKYRYKGVRPPSFKKKDIFYLSDKY